VPDGDGAVGDEDARVGGDARTEDTGDDAGRVADPR
jgi:hypothetical protein